MMSCEKNGTCYLVKNPDVLAIIVESFEAGSPFSAFLLAAEICLCFMFLASIPNTRKDSIFCFLAIVFAPFIVKTVIEAAFFVAIYFYTSSYTFWSWVHDSVVSFCYTSYLFNFQYGMVIYSLQTVRVAVKKAPVSKGYRRWPYLVIFFITLVQSALFWQIMLIGVGSVLLILVLAPFCILLSIACALCCKTNRLSDWEEVRNAKSRMLWNIPCLLLTMLDSAGQLYLTARSDSNKNNAFHNKDLVFSILYPAVVTIVMYLTLPSLRRAIVPCCYSENYYQNDRLFLLPRDSVSAGSSTASSERNSVISTNQPIVTFPNSNSVVPYHQIAPMVPFYMPPGYSQGYPHGYSQSYPQGQPMFVPVPMFYNPNHMHMSHHRPSELPPVQ